MTAPFAAAKLARDAGMAQAASHAPTFSSVAYAAIVRVARAQPFVHIDDLLKAGVPAPPHPNAWGGVWTRAIKDRVIERTIETKPCRVDRKKRAHNYPVYRSRVFNTALAEAEQRDAIEHAEAELS